MISLDDIDHEWADGCHQLAHCGQDFVEGVLACQLVRRFCIIPQPASTASNVPVREVIDNKVFEVTACFVVIPSNEIIVVGLCSACQSRENPSVKGWPIIDSGSRSFRVETIQCCVICMEFVDVPEGQKHLCIGFSHSIWIEFQRVPRCSCGHHVPASCICSFTVEVIPRVDNVPL